MDERSVQKIKGFREEIALDPRALALEVKVIMVKPLCHCSTLSTLTASLNSHAEGRTQLFLLTSISQALLKALMINSGPRVYL